MSTEPNPNPNPAPAPAPNPSPAPAAQRPEWLPETHWDAQTNAIKPEFGAHYAEVTAFHKAETEKAAALKARKPEDIKFEIKLPETVKVPDGLEVKIDPKDPRLEVVRSIAIERGWDQDTINTLASLDAQFQIAQHLADQETVKAEDAKLGANGPARKEAVKNWANGLLTGKHISEEERKEVDVLCATAAGVSFVEKMMAKINGSVPSAVNGGNPPPQPQSEKSPADRIWPTGFDRKVS